MKVVSWNVNGLRSALGKGLLDYLVREAADVVALQEVKAHPGDVSGVEWPLGYRAVWNPAQRRGYSGTLILTREEPAAVRLGIGEAEGDAEGRVITLTVGGWNVVNCYTPNAQPDLARLAFRTERWDPRFRRHVRALARNGPTLFCGDLNCAPTADDLARPRENEGCSGCTAEERRNFALLLRAGFVDTWRALHPEGNGHYSWWTYRAGARERNIGWRIDHLCIRKADTPRLRQAFIRAEVRGSDHCPIGAVLD